MEHQGAGNGVAATRQTAAVGDSVSGGLPTRRYDAGKRARDEDGSVAGDASDARAGKRLQGRAPGRIPTAQGKREGTN
jgi:hypothetical protein